MNFVFLQMAEGLRSFEWVSSVLATARTGTPVKAAQMLSCAPSTIYRTIDRLEKNVGTELFERAAAGWLPTEAGQRIIQLAEKIEAEAIEAEIFLLGRTKDFPTPLRVSASDSLVEGYLGPILAEFSRRNDDLAIELIADNHFADLARRHAHIAIRPDQRPGEGLIGRRAGKLAHALYCATSLIEQRGMPASIADLSRFKICVLSQKLSHFTSASWWSSAMKTCATPSFVANTEMGLAAAISAGGGIGVLPCFLGDRLHGISRVTAIQVSTPVDIWLVMHSSRRQNPVMRALIGALAAAMQRDAAILAGIRT